MALGSEHVQPAERDDLLVLGVGLLLELTVDRLVLGLVLGALLLVHLEQQVAVVVELTGGHLLPREVLGVAAEQDVDTSAGHIRRDGDRALAAGLSDDHGLLLVVLRVEDVVGDAATIEQRREPLGLLDRDRADQHGLALGVTLHEILDDRVPLRIFRLVDEVLLVEADHLAVRRDLGDPELVDLLELGELRLRGTRHAGEPLVHLEVVLDRDRREGLVLLLDPDALLRLDRLVEALGVPATLEHAAGELVDDLHLAVRHDVLDVAVVVLLRAERVLEVMDERRVHMLVEVVQSERLLDLRAASVTAIVFFASSAS